MAKISANGAVKTAEVRGLTRTHYPKTYVLCSDGRVLTKYNEPGTGYTLRGRIRKAADQTARTLRLLAELDGLTEIEEVTVPAATPRPRRSARVSPIR
jgi:hypothetical protein